MRVMPLFIAIHDDVSVVMMLMLLSLCARRPRGMRVYAQRYKTLYAAYVSLPDDFLLPILRSMLYAPCHTLCCVVAAEFTRYAYAADTITITPTLLIIFASERHDYAPPPLRRCRYA